MSDEITFPPMKGSGSAVAAFAIGADGSTLAMVPNGDTVVSYNTLNAEIERLRARVEVLETALRDIVGDERYDRWMRGEPNP
jgi:hypothetical protein